MWENIDDARTGCLHFEGERLYFDADEDDLLYHDEVVCIVDTKSSLQHVQLADTASQNVGI